MGVINIIEGRRKSKKLVGELETFSWADGLHTISMTWHSHTTGEVIIDGGKKVDFSPGSRIVLKNSKVVFVHKEPTE